MVLSGEAQVQKLIMAIQIILPGDSMMAFIDTDSYYCIPLSNLTFLSLHFTIS